MLSVGFGLELLGNEPLLRAVSSPGCKDFPCYRDYEIAVVAVTNPKVPVFVGFQAGLAACHFHGPPQTKVTPGCGGVMHGFFWDGAGGLSCAAGARGGHRHFGILHPENRTGEMGMKELHCSIYYPEWVINVNLCFHDFVGCFVSIRGQKLETLLLDNKWYFKHSRFRWFLNEF